MKSRVYIISAENLNSAIETIFNQFYKEPLKNKRIFVKPNMLRAAQPEDCITTDPKLVEAVVDYLLEKSALVTVGDNPIPQRVNEIETAKLCGFYEASKGYFKNVGRFIKKLKIKHRLIKELYVSRDIIDSEMLISLPKFKTHALTFLSVAIKNQFGIIPGGLKLKLHYQCPTLDDFCNLLIEIYNLKKPGLIIVDALNVVDARGRRYRLKKLIAGTDGWAVDYVCALIAGLKPELSPLLRIGLKKNLFDPKEIEIIGELSPIKGFAIPFTIPFKDFLAGIGSRMFAQIQSLWVPAFELNLCNRCNSCENVCPTRAIKYYKIDYKRCIKCYCCFEVCPKNAVKRKIKIV
ncbi:MAG: DUF362 domain-containing protein [candidate division WOR-3 bacterium]|nr:DUF362 domain-containing protein [candidate division WOR-3 bacterium]